MPPRHRVYLWAGGMIALSWLSLALIDLENEIATGFLIGTLAAQVTLAASWGALGPVPQAQRLITSIGWIFFLWIAVGIILALDFGPYNAMLELGILMISQWLLLQPILGILILGLGLHLVHRDEIETETAADPTRVQFGVLHLLITLSVIGLLLGIGRALVATVDLSGSEPLSNVFFLTITGIVMTFPVLVATLMRRNTLLAILLSLLFVAAVTVPEIFLFEQMGGRAFNIKEFATINTTSALMVLFTTLPLRLNGFFLQRTLQPAEA